MELFVRVFVCLEPSLVKELVEKYPEAVGILSRLRDFGDMVEVRFSVDALCLESFGDSRWDVVAWNHPHLGTEDLKLHGYLLAHFFDTAARSLRRNGRVVLALLEGQEARWELAKHAAAQGFKVHKAVPFETSSFPGYECKRNSTGKSFKNLHVQKATAAPMLSRLYHLLHVESGLTEFFEGADVTAPVAHNTANAIAETSLACNHCGKVFSTCQGLKTHVRQVHELKKYGDRASVEHKCECGRAFRDAEALSQHKRAAHNNNHGAAQGGSRRQGYSYRSCEVCGMSLALGTSMAAHLEALRPVDRRVFCACGRSFPEPRALEQHLRTCAEAASLAEPKAACTSSVFVHGLGGFLQRLCWPCQMGIFARKMDRALCSRKDSDNCWMYFLSVSLHPIRDAMTLEAIRSGNGAVLCAFLRRGPVAEG